MSRLLFLLLPSLASGFGMSAPFPEAKPLCGGESSPAGFEVVAAPRGYLKGLRKIARDFDPKTPLKPGVPYAVGPKAWVVSGEPPAWMKEGESGADVPVEGLWAAAILSTDGSYERMIRFHLPAGYPVRRLALWRWPRSESTFPTGARGELHVCPDGGISGLYNDVFVNSRSF